MNEQCGHHDDENRRTDQAGRWSDCGRGSRAAGGGGTASPETQMHLNEGKLNLIANSTFDCHGSIIELSVPQQAQRTA